MKQIIVNILKKSKHLDKIPEQQLLNLIEIPPSFSMGDFAFPCFFLAKQMKTSPNEIAKQIRADLGAVSLPNEFESIETQGPYINFFLNKKQLAANTINEILKQKDKYGSLDIGRGKLALIEHTSINPNASPHVGRARNAIIGDSIVRILRFMNFKTEVHYYVNDVSKQIAMLVLAKSEKLPFEKMLKRYIDISKKVSKSKKLEQEVFKLLLNFEHNDKATRNKFKSITKTCVKGQEKILAQLGIKYDVFDYESDYITKASDLLKKFSATNKLKKDKDGRYYLDQSNTSVERKMKAPVLVLTRSDSTGLYPLRDISYTIEKIQKSKTNIIVLGEDQKLYFEQISEALKLLNVASPKVVHYSFILLKEKTRGKNARKMSTRKGDVILLEDFLNDAISKAKKKAKNNPSKIAVAAVKYSILRNQPNKVIMFNLDDALNFEGDTGPYLLYSYARASSILKKVKQRKSHRIEYMQEKEDGLEKQAELIKKLSQFPEVAAKAYNDLNPSHIANYSYDIAKTFNEFYHLSKVIGSKDEEFKLQLIQAFRQVIKNSLSLLGIEVIEEM